MGGGVSFEWVGTAQGLIGLILASFTLIGTVALWFQRRMRAAASEVTRDIGSQQQAVTRRLEDVEGDVTGLKRQLTGVAGRIEQVEGRLRGVETSIEGLARADTLSALRADMMEFRGAVTAELKATSGKLDTLYQAALDQGRRNR